MTRDLVTGLVCLITSLVLLALTIGLPGPSLLVPVGPGFYPRIILGISTFFSVLLVGQALIERRRGVSQAERTEERPNYTLVFITFAVFGLYVGVLPYIGYRLSTFAFVLGLYAVLEPPRGTRAWAIAVGFALITTFVTYHLFQDYLQVLMPRGRWTDF